jgi:predicted nuclease of predicted toxin-antitoxin system
MKFLIDRCAGHRLAEWLRSQGHDVLEASERGPDPGDALLLEWAADEKRVFVTIDMDFGRLIFKDRERHSGMIRLPAVPADARIAVLMEVLQKHHDQLAAGAVVTARRGRFRVSMPPDRPSAGAP